jgi:hypothetical protein
MMKIYGYFFVMCGNPRANHGKVLWANNGFDNMRVIIVVSARMVFHGIKYILNCLKKQGGSSPNLIKKEEKPMKKKYWWSFEIIDEVNEIVQGIVEKEVRGNEKKISSYS